MPIKGSNKEKCLAPGDIALESGTYYCMECKDWGKDFEVRVEVGDKLPLCDNCGEKARWCKK